MKGATLIICRIKLDYKKNTDSLLTSRGSGGRWKGGLFVCLQRHRPFAMLICWIRETGAETRFAGLQRLPVWAAPGAPHPLGQPADREAKFGPVRSPARDSQFPRPPWERWGVPWYQPGSPHPAGAGTPENAVSAPPTAGAPWPSSQPWIQRYRFPVSPSLQTRNVLP